MGPLATPPGPPHTQSGLATAVSMVAHGAVVMLVLSQAGRPVFREISQILPALYLYAPDRQPASPRELRIPIPAPEGVHEGAVVRVPSTQPGGETAPRKPVEKLGVAPPGQTTIRLDSVFSVLAVDSEVVRYPSSAPLYPQALLDGGVEGSVEAEFVVDTTGRVDLTTIKILSSTHEDFSASVQTALAGALFRPAWRNLRKVRQLVHQRFAFRIYRGPDSVSM